MNRFSDPNQTAVSAVTHLLITSFLIGIISSIVYAEFSERVWIVTAVLLTGGVAGGMGILLNLHLLRAIHKLDWALLRLLGNQPVTLERGLLDGPLAGVMQKMAYLTGQERPFATQRETLLQQVSEAAAQETRNRLARDLHDSIKQQLFTISITTAAAQKHLPHNPKEASTLLNDVRQSTQGALVEMNALLQQLSPTPLAQVGLVQALTEQADALGHRTEAAVSTKFEPLPEDEQIPTGVQETLFRIAQEGLSNVARHARADQVWLRLFVQNGHLTLELEDDGAGFDGTAVTSGMGIPNMQNQAAELGGTLTIQSEPSIGTTIRAVFPLLRGMSQKEQAMITTNHALNKVGIVAVGGALLLTLLLFYPLFVVLPGQLLPQWGQGSTAVAIGLTAISFPLMLGIGKVASEQYPFSSQWGRMWVGGMATAVAFSLFFFLLGGSATIVSGGRSLIAEMVSTTTSEEAVQPILESISGISLWVFGGYWLGVGISGLLGGLGGRWLSKGEAIRDKPASIRAVLLTLPIALALSSGAILWITAVFFPFLGSELAKAASTLEINALAATFGSRIVETLPLLSAFLFYFLAVGLSLWLLWQPPKSSPAIQKWDYVIQLYGLFLITAVLPHLLKSTAPSSVILNVGIGVNIVVLLVVAWLLNHIEGTYRAKWPSLAHFAPWLLWATAVLPYVVLYLQEILALWLLLLLGVLYAIINHRHRDISASESVSAKNGRLATAIGAILPGILTFMTVQVPFFVATIGLTGLILPAVGGEGATAVYTLVQQIYRINPTALGILFLFSIVVISIVLIVLKLSTLWGGENNQRLTINRQQST